MSEYHFNYPFLFPFMIPLLTLLPFSHTYRYLDENTKHQTVPESSHLPHPPSQATGGEGVRDSE